jgi:hypothetical protein
MAIRGASLVSKSPKTAHMRLAALQGHPLQRLHLVINTLPLRPITARLSRRIATAPLSIGETALTASNVQPLTFSAQVHPNP